MATIEQVGMYGAEVGTLKLNDDSVQWVSPSKSTKSVSIASDAVSGASWHVCGKMGYLTLTSVAVTPPPPGSDEAGKKSSVRSSFDGIPISKFDDLKAIFADKYKVKLEKVKKAYGGPNFGLTTLTDGVLEMKENIINEDNESAPRNSILSLNLNEVSQCVMKGKTAKDRNNIELQFHENDELEAESDQLVQISFYVPPGADADPNDKDTQTAAEILHEQLLAASTTMDVDTATAIATFDEDTQKFLVPSGKYNVSLHNEFLRLQGSKYDYKIKYTDVTKLFLLNNPDGRAFFVIMLDKMIRQGQQRHKYLVMQLDKSDSTVDINLDEEQMKAKGFQDQLSSTMSGKYSNLVAKIFKIVTGKKVFVTGKFKSYRSDDAIKCSVKANDGLLYPLEKQFIWLHRPPLVVRFDEIQNVEFERYGGNSASTRNFDLAVNLKNGQKYNFSGIEKTEFPLLKQFIESKKMRIINLADDSRRKSYNEGSDSDGPDAGAIDMDDEDSEDDGDYGAEDAQKEEDEESSDDSDMSDSDMSEGSDVAEARKRARGETVRAPAKKKAKKSAAGSSPKRKGGKKKDPNAPKRGMSAYMFFSNEKRPEIVEADPTLKFGEIATKISAMWKEISDEDKAPYEEKAAADKARYLKEMETYVPPEPTSDDDEPAAKKSPKKKAPKKDPNAPKKGKGSYMFFAEAKRSEFKELYPELSFGDLSKKIGEAWKTITDEEKAPYEESAAKDKERYLRETEAYEKMKKEALAMSSSSESDDSDDSDDSADSDSE